MKDSGIAKRLELIRENIRSLAISNSRPPESIALIAVSKLNPIESIIEAAQAGQMDFGENHVQELVAKHSQRPDLRWHMIGTLQRNKVKYIASFIHLIHSIDSERLLMEVSLQGAKCGRTIPCLLQINISAEPQKGGFEIDQAEALLHRIHEFPNVDIRGLMGMAEFTDNEAVLRTQFALLRDTAAQFKSLEGNRISMKELSMGMSGDFPIAIAEGATMVRVGSSIFGNRNHP